MPDYNKLAENALKLIAKSGAKYVIKRVTVAFDQETGEQDSAATKSGSLTAVILPRYKGQVFESLDSNIKNAIIAGKAKTVLTAAKDISFEPAPLDEVTIGGKQWKVIGVTELSPAGVPLLYTIGVIQV